MAGELWVDFKAVKAEVTIEAVLKRYGILEKFERKGDRLIGPCPIHKGTNKKQFSASVSTGGWKCFSGHCGKGGNVIDLVAAVEGVPFRDAALLLQGWFGITPRRSAKDSDDSRCSADSSGEEPERPTPTEMKDGKEAGPPSRIVERDATENQPLTFQLKLETAHTYLTERGLADKTIVHFGLGFATRGSMKDRIAIPVHNERGDLIAYAGRWAGKADDLPAGEGKYKLPAGFHKGHVVYNLHRATGQSNRVIVVEGFWAVFWLTQCGFPNVVALMGSSATERQLDLIVERFKGVQLLLDGDDAGRAAAAKIASDLVRRVWVRVLECPDKLQPDRLPAHELKRLLT